MSDQLIKKEDIKKSTIADMKKLKTYKPEFDPIINIYSELREQYFEITKEYKNSGYKYSEETRDGGTKKSPITATLETLRKDILQYSDRLCLNPKSLNENKIEVSKKKISKLGEALAEIEKQKI